jgi:hypothetical protein
MKAAKREKYGKREHDRLIKMLEQAGDYQVLPKVKEEPMDTPDVQEAEAPVENVDVDEPVIVSPQKSAGAKRVRRSRRIKGRKSRKDADVESSEDDKSDNEAPMEVSPPEKEAVARVYSRKTKRDQFGNYPPWMSVRKINKQKKRNKRLHSQKRKLIKAKKIK